VLAPNSVGDVMVHASCNRGGGSSSRARDVDA
jgi:hypothetical protein